MIEQDSNQELVRAARTVTLKVVSETSILKAKIVKGIVNLNAFTQSQQGFPHKVALGVIEVYLRGSFYVIIANASDSVITLAKHQHIVKTSLSPSKIISIKHDKDFPHLTPCIPVNSVKVVHLNQPWTFPINEKTRDRPRNWRLLT